MKKLNNFNEDVIRVSHISVINMLEEKIGKDMSTWNELKPYSIKNLEELRDALVIEYNDVMEARRFGAEMIYGRSKNGG